MRDRCVQNHMRFVSFAACSPDLLGLAVATQSAAAEESWRGLVVAPERLRSLQFDGLSLPTGRGVADHRRNRRQGLRPIHHPGRKKPTSSTSTMKPVFMPHSDFCWTAQELKLLTPSSFRGLVDDYRHL